MLDLEKLFGSDGPLAKTIDAYRPRAAQVEMAEAIIHAMADKKHLITEAGTGTGKTFAYLIPAILSGKKTVISTGTKNLQDQLFNKDLPLLRRALEQPFQAALLKGRSNYLCRYRLDNALNSGVGFSREDAAALSKINAWAGSTRTGDISEVTDVAESAPVWLQATSNVDNCLGQDCPVYSECCLVKARRRAQEAELVVVNHHLLCADWSLREGGFGELLPDVDVVIVDEAHQLAETASNFLGLSVGARQINELARDAVLESHKDAPDMVDLRKASTDLEHTVRELRLAFGVAVRRGAWQELINNRKIADGIDDLRERLQGLTRILKIASERGKGLDNCFGRSKDIELRLKRFMNDDSGNWVRWFETHKRSFSLNRTPIDVAGEFQNFVRAHAATWIFTSATLSVANRFDHFAASLGLEEAKSMRWESPFDYQRQSLFYHPRGLPDPASGEFVSAVCRAAIPVLQASRGRAFFLFTSHRALSNAAAMLGDKLDYPLFIQGSLPKSVLLERFRSHGNAVLMGTSSFWEGVDVRGPALSCVIIDKLPFASPADPVLRARLDALRQRGMSPFDTYQLPAAVIALKQGIGRLIRDVNDRGVLMLCDPRLLKRSYGRVFLDSVPPMKRTRSIEDVETFFANENEAAES
ncbi:MAG: ATP-dependent DNA helicase [Pseudomonadota bacterium]